MTTANQTFTASFKFYSRIENTTSPAEGCDVWHHWVGHHKPTTGQGLAKHRAALLNPVNGRLVTGELSRRLDLEHEESTWAANVPRALAAELMTTEFYTSASDRSWT